MRSFKSVSEDIRQQPTTPPMLLQLRRQAIRNFPNGERVALYSNPQLKIQLAIPYDSQSGHLKPVNAPTVAEAFSPGDVVRVKPEHVNKHPTNQRLSDKPMRVEEPHSNYPGKEGHVRVSMMGDPRKSWSAYFKPEHLEHIKEDVLVESPEYTEWKNTMIGQHGGGLKFSTKPAHRNGSWDYTSFAHKNGEQVGSFVHSHRAAVLAGKHGEAARQKAMAEAVTEEHKWMGKNVLVTSPDHTPHRDPIGEVGKLVGTFRNPVTKKQHARVSFFSEVGHHITEPPMSAVRLHTPYKKPTTEQVNEMTAHRSYPDWEQTVRQHGAVDFKYAPPTTEMGADDEVHRGHTVAYGNDGHVKGTWNHVHNLGIVTEDVDFGEYLHQLKASDPKQLDAIKHRVMGRSDAKHWQHFHNAALAYHEGNMRSANNHWRKFMAEDVDGEDDDADRSNKVQTLAAAFDALQAKPELDELDNALYNWLSSEVEEHGDFSDMDNDVLDDTYDDYVNLTAEEVQTVLEAAPRFGNQSPLLRKVAAKNTKVTNTCPKHYASFGDWYAAAEKKGGTGEIRFQLHNAAGTTTATKHGKPIGSFCHVKQHGELTESVIHRLQRIVRTGKEEEVHFANGDCARVHPVTAQAICDLHDKVNHGNKRKVSEMINSGLAGLTKVGQFSHDLLRRGDK